MASAAAPTDPKFRAAAYQLSGCDDPFDDGHAECTVGARSGAIVVGPFYSKPGCGDYDLVHDLGYDISLSFSKLSPNTEYLASLTTHPDTDGNTVYDYGSGDENNIISVFTSDENGRARLTDSLCYSSHREFIKSQLESGYIVGLIPVPFA